MNWQKYPKVELHRHLECSIRFSSLIEAAKQVGIKVPADLQAQREMFLITEPMKDLGTVLRKFLNLQKTLATREILERLAYEACEDAFRDGIRLMEYRYAPTFIEEGHNLSLDEIHRAIVSGVRRAERDFPIAVGLIATIQRIKSLKDAERTMDFVLDHRDNFVGVDLADDEAQFESIPFAGYFKKAARGGLGVTIHAGEIPSPLAPRWIKEAVEYLGATRIGHGVQVYRSSEVMEWAKENELVFELCPTSNVLTNAVPHLREHPIRALKKFGLKTTINSDDPTVFDVTLSQEYENLETYQGFSTQDFQDCNRDAFLASFVPWEKKRAVWQNEWGTLPSRHS